ncbi:hypothetical protein J7E93_33825 [Streptomyces sp. ISL-36]|uniref:phospholipase D-like domain-containing protein n=1 Tax=Streptomyces sp. ISL-36 TaxID=2819182 RepID=UPI001BEBD409|nr:phospholipase D-like domain-containing protein [Streptomyces sp. ISL-36]MBT2444988.1 hypothetical protein [Streptomyces sp. ISL-36]
MRNLAALAALICTTSLLGAPGAVAEETVGAKAVFNNPASGLAADRDAVRDELVDLIDAAAPGSEIHGSMYLFTDGVVSAALARAVRDDGVKVKLLLDGDAIAETNASGDATGTEYPTLVTSLGVDRTADSWVMACPAERGCIGNRTLDADDDGAINHNKFFLFSQVGTTPKVVFQTSANLTKNQRVNMYNNAVTIPDAGSGLYDEYLHYWNDLAVEGAKGAAGGTDDYYRTTQSGPYKTYFFPRKETGNTYSTDPDSDTVVSLLGNVGQCTDGAGAVTRIRIGMFAFTRPQVAQSLVALQGKGCQVEVIHNGESGNIGSVVKQTLQGKITSLRRCAGTVTDSLSTRTIGVHSKYMLIEGNYLGAWGRKLVFTGSHNYTFPNLRSHDETLLKIDNAAVYTAFAANFETMRNSGMCQQY